MGYPVDRIRRGNQCDQHWVIYHNEICPIHKGRFDILLNKMNPQKMTMTILNLRKSTKVFWSKGTRGFFAKQFIHFIKRDTKNTENKSLHTFNKY